MTTTVNINSALKINVTPIEDGASGRVLFQKSDGKLGQSSNLFWDDTNSRLSIGQGTVPGARLDVRSQGTLSTDIAFRVRNSAGTNNFLVVNGAGDVFNNGFNGVVSNSFFGENCGRSATGTNNCGFGNEAIRVLSTGNSNSAFGFRALYSVTTGGTNIAFGESALFSNVSGNGNTSVGVNSSLLTTGSSNTVFGGSAFQNNTTGSNNVVLGRDSGRYASGGGNLSISNNSVFLGFDARANASNETNQIVIGYQAIGTGSHSVTLGNTSITRTNLRGQIVISGFTSAPTGIEGAIYYDTVLKKHYGFNGTNWNALY